MRGNDFLPVWEKDSSRQTRNPAGKIYICIIFAPSGAGSVGRMLVSLTSADNIFYLSL
jgi:hypothetical protein